MATISIKMAQELGLTPEEQKKLELRLAQIEFKQAEKSNSNGDYSKAIHRYKLASEIIHNFQDSLVKIIKDGTKSITVRVRFPANDLLD